MKADGKSKIVEHKKTSKVKKKKGASKVNNVLSEGALKLRALVDQAAQKAVNTDVAELSNRSASRIPDVLEREPIDVVDSAHVDVDDSRNKQRLDISRTKKRGRIEPKDYVDDPNVVFIGNVPLSVDKGTLIKKLGIDPKIVKSIHFRSLPVESKFARNKRIGVIRGKLSDAKATQNAYVTLVDEKHVDELLGKNTMEIDGHYLFINKTSPSSFSKFNRKKTIFVGKLPKSTTENELFDVFSNVSQVKAVRIIRDPMTQKSKGFGFVAFDERTAVPEAIRAFHNKKYKGYTLNVMKALDHEKAAAFKAKDTKKRAGKKGAHGKRDSSTNPRKKPRKT
ncbi:RNA recognition motif domain containing protein [Babesia ovis]|uniref:RNA recognition motif domain containing protein n=1 Tax=Babesia ovis TaxID=5869 RepID=A0A9W5WU40_BABOV|nr:RNA recognition motif domain containing protein [Babesia ovis]